MPKRISVSNRVYSLGVSCVLILAVMQVSSCEEDEPEIISITPTSGYPGNNVTITGSRFDPARTTVGFRGTDAVIVSISDTQIVAKVPAASDTGPVIVYQGDHVVAGPLFTYKKPPAVAVSNPTDVQSTEAMLNGNITSTGTEGVTGAGFSYLNLTPSGGSLATISAGAKTTTGPYSVRLTGLTKNTTYHIRAYATSSDTTIYSGEISFTTMN